MAGETVLSVGRPLVGLVTVGAGLEHLGIDPVEHGQRPGSRVTVARLAGLAPELGGPFLVRVVAGGAVGVVGIPVELSGNSPLEEPLAIGAARRALGRGSTGLGRDPGPERKKTQSKNDQDKSRP